MLVIKISISISHYTVLSSIWSIFSRFFFFANLFLEFLASIQQNMRKEENIGNIVQRKRAITSLSLTCKISTACC